MHLLLFLVAKLCPTFCDPMDCSMSSFPVLHHLPELAQPMSIELVMPSNHLILCKPLLFPPSIFPASVSFPMSQFFASSGQCIGGLNSASVLVMNIHSWFPLGLTGWISLQPKRFSRVFSNTTVQKHQLGAQPSLWSNSHIHTWPLERP